MQKWVKIFATSVLAILSLHSFKGARISAQNFPAIIGRIEGDDLQVVTTTPAGVENHAAPTVVANGSDVTLRSGGALLMLDAGGKISICGPAHFRVLKSSGAVTLALDYGRVHSSLDSADAFMIYTPTVVATPIAISGGPRDMTLGLEQGGEMCVLTSRGALRVEPQFSDQSLIVPQGGTVNLSGGQVESLHGDVNSCSCDFSAASVEHAKPSPTEPPREISALSHPVQPAPKTTEDAPPPPATEEPVYTVLMPPLSFDAGSPTPPPTPDPETILLVREVRLRPTVVFRGHVNPPPAPAAAPPVIPAPPEPSPGTNDNRPLESRPGLLNKLRNLFWKFTGRGPCAGAGCSN